ncbi:DNA polymerase III subunit gamma/tau [Desulforhopalus sp. IMCC35007]|uniref:DNA polymerase III subunit gamma/tau n=1 Tax=Desulforhopalus sp. IMCC35007 TaxID=2569543 RepID=UPI0010AEE3C7|nr:DNA polymerase III subunit gamma/tau [Desulforhopalus sp. IMCC35007]TKB07158.1 DNA polymerase III subunit gamma/tau [Desulforhopalus sp. IMCC35007]
MSYLVLARKSRPQTFDQVVGQRPVVKTLRNSIIRDRVAHAILFSGVRGVGKTTLARIMAKAINCSDETAHRPCDKCPSCKEISSGSSLDLYEIDGASNRGIQEIRELKEKIRFLPSSAKYKVIIIDEVHMLTTEAFNALLKTLEEPPAHVYFMFATTEIHKIPITILSRCQQYELQRISAKELYDHFAKLATSEGFQIEPSALALIVREAAGSVRDGLSLLDQMFSFGDTTIKASDVAEVLGLVDREVLGTLTRGLLEGDKTAVFTSLETVFSFGMDIKRFTADLLNQFRNLLLCKIDGCTELLDLPEEELRQIQSMAADYTSETIHLKLSLLMQMTEQLKQSSQARIAIETSFLKIIEATNVVPLSSLLGHLQEIMPGLPVTATLQKQAVAPQSTESKKKTDIAVKTAPNQNLKPALPQTQGGPADPHNPSNNKVKQDSTQSPAPSYLQEQAPLPPEPEELTRATPPANSSPADKSGKNWTGFIDYIKEDTVWMATNLQRADSVYEEIDGVITVIFSDGMNCSLLCQKENQQHLDEFALAFFKRPIKIKIVVPEIDDNPDTNSGESPQKKRQQLINDPLVTMAAEIFNGQIGDVRIISK